MHFHSDLSPSPLHRRPPQSSAHSQTALNPLTHSLAPSHPHTRSLQLDSGRFPGQLFAPPRLLDTGSFSPHIRPPLIPSHRRTHVSSEFLTSTFGSRWRSNSRHHGHESLPNLLQTLPRLHSLTATCFTFRAQGFCISLTPFVFFSLILTRQSLSTFSASLYFVFVLFSYCFPSFTRRRSVARLQGAPRLFLLGAPSDASVTS